MKKSFSFTHYYERRNSDVSENEPLILQNRQKNYFKYIVECYMVMLVISFSLFLFAFFTNILVQSKYGDLQYKSEYYEKSHILTRFNQTSGIFLSIFLFHILIGLFIKRNPLKIIWRRLHFIIGAVVGIFCYNISVINTLQEICDQ